MPLIILIKLTFNCADDGVQVSHGTQALVSTYQRFLHSWKHLVAPSFQLAHLRDLCDFNLEPHFTHWLKMSHNFHAEPIG